MLTRGAGFGYLGSTVTSLIYASFTFIFFALEAAIMAMALNMLFGLPLHFGYLIGSVVVIPRHLGVHFYFPFSAVHPVLLAGATAITLYFHFNT